MIGPMLNLTLLIWLALLAAYLFSRLADGDVQNGGADGDELGIGTDGEEVGADACCCSAGTCPDCSGDQVSAVVTSSGSCGSVAGTYAWMGGMTWELSLGVTLQASCIDGLWTVTIIHFTYGTLYEGTTTELTCVDGVLEGTVVMDGWDATPFGGPDCTGQTATATW